MAVAAIPQIGTVPAQQTGGMVRARGVSAPALLAAVSFACGILTARLQWIQPGQLLVALALTMSLAALAAVRGGALSLGLSGLVCLLLGLFCDEAQPRFAATTPLMRIADATPAPTPWARRQGFRSGHLIRGRIVRTGMLRTIDSPQPYSDKVRREHSQQMDLRVEAVDGVALGSPEGLRLTLYAPAQLAFPSPGCGDRVQAYADIHTQERFLDPGVWDARGWLRQQGISVLGSTRAENVTVTDMNSGAEPGCRLHRLQQAASARLVSFAEQPGPRWLPALLKLTHDDGAMLTAMLTGDRSLLGHRLRVGFERTGSFHLLVVSGLHLAIFSGLVFWAARRLLLPRAAASLATIGLSLAYALFTGFGQPVQRAFWMITLYLTGRLLWRERHPLNAVGCAALVMLAVSPGALSDAGFQMTLLSVLAVGGIAAPLAGRSFGPYLRASRELGLIEIDPSLPPPVAQFRVTLRMLSDALRPWGGRWIADRLFPQCVRRALEVGELVATSLAIELLMVLPMAVYFHRATTVALPVNILIVPLLGLLLPLALLTLLLVLLLPKAALAPAAAVAALLHGVRALVQASGAMRWGDLRMPAPAEWAIVVFVVLAAAALILVRLPRLGPLAAAGALATAAAVTLLPRPLAHQPGMLEISALDVGQGDSILVITPAGKALLIDAGGVAGAAGPNNAAAASGASSFDIGEDVVSPVLWARGIRRLDAAAITHAHADHIGGMAAVLANFRPRELWVGINPHAAMYDSLLSQALALHTQLIHHVAGDRFSFGDVQVRVLAPAADYRPAGAPGNNDSLVLQLRFGKTRALLDGDAEAPSEERMTSEGDLRSDLLKVGHHGSRTSTTPEFLAAVSPAWSAVSVGRRNFYGHPRREVLEELEKAHVRTFRTDLLGLSTFYLDGGRVMAASWPGS